MPNTTSSRPRRMTNPSGTPPKPSTAKPAEPDMKRIGVRAKALDEAVGMLCIPLIAKAAADEAKLEEDQISPYALDLYTVAEHKDDLIGGVLQLAEAYPVLGSIIDKLGVVGPVGALVTTVITIGAQIAENHKALPETVSKVLPVVDRNELALAVKQNAASHKAPKNNGDGES